MLGMNIKEVSKDNMMQTIHWLVQHTPYRLAGSEDEKRASEYICERMERCGLEVTNETFYTYNSDPISSSFEVIAPEHFTMDSLPCAHIHATKPEGEAFDLVYIGNGSYADYEGRDVAGKLVLVEVTYAPPVPEKARIAAEMGAAGIVCMNWGNDEEVICCRGLKGVWGNPTEETFPKIPDIIGVGITRLAGLRLKKLCLNGSVRVKVSAVADRKWSLVHQPKGILRADNSNGDFLLVCSHLDAWKPGVTCNATGNATTLEICRLLSKYRSELKRDVYFLFWNGHEIAEAAGSTWFIDNYWKLLDQHCVGYMHIDSTGVRETKLYEIKASEELLDFAVGNYHDYENKDVRAMALKKIGDQSFMGIGVPSVTQRMSFTQEDMDKAHGATLGWWNHTKEDGLDKCDPDILVADTEITLQMVDRLATVDKLPYDFSHTLSEFHTKLESMKEKFGEHLAMDDVLKSTEDATDLILEVQNSRDHADRELYNTYVKRVCRLLTNVVQTYADKYSQDSYGNSKLTYSVPLLSELERLSKMNPDSLEYGLVKTQLLKNKNRIIDAMNTLIDLSKFCKGFLFKQ